MSEMFLLFYVGVALTALIVLAQGYAQEGRAKMIPLALIACAFWPVAVALEIRHQRRAQRRV